MEPQEFDRSKHVYHNDAFDELVKEAVRFFNGTPVHSLPPPNSFFGTGVYALYYIGKFELYKKYSELNRLAYDKPIYVGKAVPRGWRQSRISDRPNNRSRELFTRLCDHGRSIQAGSGISLDEFKCRFVIFESNGSDMISTIEAALIKIHRPLWNVTLDGFGNHTPGNGRFEQARSDWDVIHPGRPWADQCKGRHNSHADIIENIEAYFNSIG